jgi:hypothetical protein
MHALKHKKLDFYCVQDIYVWVTKQRILVRNSKMTLRHLVLFSLTLACLTYAAPSRGQSSRSEPSEESIRVRTSEPRDLNKSIYYKNKLEFSLDYGWLPINIPWPFDFFAGSGYNMTPLKYTLEPNIASLRWHLTDVGGPWIFRGNWDMQFSGSFTAIPRGPETRYWSYDMGIRRNFVRRNWRVTPYFDVRLGLGDINAKEPKGFTWAQGQDFTFTVNLGSGVRYDFNSRFSLSAGLNFMHISNFWLSEPRYTNYGINVYGPMVGMNIRLGKPKEGLAQQHLVTR